MSYDRLRQLLNSAPATAEQESSQLITVPKIPLGANSTQILSVLQTILQNEQEILTAIQALTGIQIQVPVSGLPIASILTPWQAQPEILLLDHVSWRSASAFVGKQMVDMRNQKRLVIKIESSLDVDVSVQLMGDFSDTTAIQISNGVEVGSSVPCAANSTAGIGVGVDGNWYPFLGIQVTPAAAPSQGIITARAITQE